MPKQTGRLSKEHIKYILDNRSSMSVEELAEKLNRTTGVIQKCIRDNSHHTKDVDDPELDIQKMTYWNDIVSQFSSDEQVKFISLWNDMIEQFMQDVLPSEIIQIIDMIKLELLMNRVLTQQQQTSLQIEDYENRIKEEEKKGIEDRSVELVIHLETIAANLRSSNETHTRQYKDYLTEKNKLFEKLKSTRNQRLNVLENTKENFPQWLQKLLRDPYLQKSYGERMAKMRQAMEKERERLSAWHEYEDGAIDRPFLTPEVVLEND